MYFGMQILNLVLQNLRVLETRLVAHICSYLLNNRMCWVAQLIQPSLLNHKNSIVHVAIWYQGIEKI